MTSPDRSLSSLQHLIPSLKTCDPETYGDIYLDVAEALMERKQYDEALNLLNILTATENFSLVRDSCAEGGSVVFPSSL